jgi:hypothetical protein
LYDQFAGGQGPDQVHQQRHDQQPEDLQCDGVPDPVAAQLAGEDSGRHVKRGHEGQLLGYPPEAVGQVFQRDRLAGEQAETHILHRVDQVPLHGPEGQAGRRQIREHVDQVADEGGHEKPAEAVRGRLGHRQQIEGSGVDRRGQEQENGVLSPLLSQEPERIGDRLQEPDHDLTRPDCHRQVPRKPGVVQRIHKKGRKDVKQSAVEARVRTQQPGPDGQEEPQTDQVAGQLGPDEERINERATACPPCNGYISSHYWHSLSLGLGLGGVPDRSGLEPELQV